MKFSKAILRSTLEFFKNIKFWWEIPEFINKNRKKGAFHIKYLDKINIPPDKVKEIAVKQQKELHIYLEDEELSLLSELNSSSHSYQSSYIDSYNGIFSLIYLLCVLSLIGFPLINDCLISQYKMMQNYNIVVCGYDSIMESPISHPLFFKVIYFSLFEKSL